MMLSFPVDLQDPKHPLARLRAHSGGGLNLVDLFGDRPSFPESEDEPLIQLADLAGWLLRRAITHPDEAHTQTAYRLLKQRLYRPPDGMLPFRLFFRRGRTFTRADLPRYEHLFA